MASTSHVPLHSTFADPGLASHVPLHSPSNVPSQRASGAVAAQVPRQVPLQLPLASVLPSHVPSQVPSHAPNPRSSQTITGPHSQSVRSSQSFANGQLPFPPPPSRKGSGVIWIVLGVGVVAVALIGGTLLALFLR